MNVQKGANHMSYMYVEGDITQEDLKLVKGCLLTTKETLKILPFKTNDIKAKLKEIDIFLKRFCEKKDI